MLYNKSGNESWVDVLRKMRANLAEGGYTQVPQLSSSRIIDVNEPMTIVENPSGTKRALLIGINYTGQQGELSGCHNDAKNISKYLQNELGFESRNMRVLMDDGAHQNPTYANIMSAFDWIASVSEPGDTVWIHYSGHGGRLPDQNGDEEDGYDETLIPVDFQSAGQIRDDDVLKHLVKPMREGVTMTCLMDCCHSGTVLDLPYRFIADGDHVSLLRSVLTTLDIESFMMLTSFCVFCLIRSRWKETKVSTLKIGWAWLQMCSRRELQFTWLEKRRRPWLIVVSFCNVKQIRLCGHLLCSVFCLMSLSDTVPRR